jgi:hypothetical protein
MTIERFQSVLHQVPFRPFTIRMADGRSFEVPHPDFVAHAPSGRKIILVHPDDNYSILDLLLMSELEVQSANGRPA